MLFRTENLSYKQIARLTASLVGFVGGAFVLSISRDFIFTIVAIVILFVFTYYILGFLLDRFVHRKLHLIYKLISKEKASLKLTNEMRDKTIDEVKEDVERWAVEKHGEISRLQNNESFRKEFLMNLAHELRTPIFSIQGYIATLLDGEINNPEVNIRFLENASRSADRLSGLVDNLREISQYESQQIRLEKSDFNIQKVIKKVFAEMKPIADEREITLSVKKGSEGDLVAWADKERVEQVLINLIQNGIKYGIHGGYVKAGVYNIDNEQILIEISDNGMGMTEEQSPRAFERFFRTDDARTADKHGNGLGLAIVKHIIEAHNHTISCRSAKDSGTTFSFTIDQDD